MGNDQSQLGPQGREYANGNGPQLKPILIRRHGSFNDVGGDVKNRRNVNFRDLTEDALHVNYNRANIKSLTGDNFKGKQVFHSENNSKSRLSNGHVAEDATDNSLSTTHIANVNGIIPSEINAQLEENRRRKGRAPKPPSEKGAVKLPKMEKFVQDEILSKARDRANRPLDINKVENKAKKFDFKDFKMELAETAKQFYEKKLQDGETSINMNAYLDDRPKRRVTSSISRMSDSVESLDALSNGVDEPELHVAKPRPKTELYQSTSPKSTEEAKNLMLKELISRKKPSNITTTIEKAMDKVVDQKIQKELKVEAENMSEVGSRGSIADSSVSKSKRIIIDEDDKQHLIDEIRKELLGEAMLLKAEREKSEAARLKEESKSKPEPIKHMKDQEEQTEIERQRDQTASKKPQSSDYNIPKIRKNGEFNMTQEERRRIAREEAKRVMRSQMLQEGEKYEDDLPYDEPPRQRPQVSRSAFYSSYEDPYSYPYQHPPPPPPKAEYPDSTLYYASTPMQHMYNGYAPPPPQMHQPQPPHYQTGYMPYGPPPPPQERPPPPYQSQFYGVPPPMHQMPHMMHQTPPSPQPQYRRYQAGRPSRYRRNPMADVRDPYQSNYEEPMYAYNEEASAEDIERMEQMYDERNRYKNPRKRFGESWKKMTTSLSKAFGFNKSKPHNRASFRDAFENHSVHEDDWDYNQMTGSMYDLSQAEMPNEKPRQQQQQQPREKSKTKPSTDIWKEIAQRSHDGLHTRNPVYTHETIIQTDEAEAVFTTSSSNSDFNRRDDSDKDDFNRSNSRDDLRNVHLLRKRQTSQEKRSVFLNGGDLGNSTNSLFEKTTL